MKKVIAMLLMLCMVLSMSVVASAAGTPVKVDTYEELLAALATDNANIIMTADITGNATEDSGYAKAGICLNAGDVLDGNGHKLTINGANMTWGCVIAMRGGEVKNLTISGAMRGVFMPGANGDVVIDNCKFEDVIYTFNSDGGNVNYSVTVKNCTINGWTSFSNVHKSVVFENCTFGEGNGYAYCRPYQATTFIGCDFADGYEFDNHSTDGSGLKFDDCTYAGEPLSEENNDMFYAGGEVVINGTVADVNQYVAAIGEQKYFSLQAAINAAVSGDVITLLDDIKEDAVVTQKPDFEITIDGNGNIIDGTILVDGKSARYETTALTIKNIDFFTDDALAYDAFINLGNGSNSTRYTNNVTVENCTFDASGVAPVAIKSYTGGDWNLKVIGCTVSENMHSLLQAANVEKGLEIKNCKVYSKNGVNLNYTPSLEMTGCEFSVRGYALRAGVNGTIAGEGKEFVLENNILESACEDGDAVIIFRDDATQGSLFMEENSIIGDLHFLGNTEETEIDANRNYWGGDEPLEEEVEVEICEYYSDAERTTLVTEHKDVNKDHVCDRTNCLAEGVGEHVDADKDHACDYGCDEAIGTCEDADKDHACDYGCDEVYGEHVDEDKDHACDYGCDEAIGTCVDADKDHVCDYGCDEAIGEHKDSADDKDHVCDYGCKEILEECTDKAADGDHKCDVCGKDNITEHSWKDANCTEAKTCTDCKLTEGNALGHDFKAWETLEEATENYGGRQQKVCKNCEHKVTRYTKPLSQNGITIITPADKEVEENPNTGAPVMMPVLAVVAVLSGAVISKRK